MVVDKPVAAADAAARLLLVLVVVDFMVDVVAWPVPNAHKWLMAVVSDR
jgi:hypothetical protein